MNLLHALKRLRDRFIDDVLMTRGAFRKSRYRIQGKENVYAYVARDRNGLRFLYTPTDFTVGAALIDRGEWQYDELDHYLEFLSARIGDRNAWFFDIGANIGTQTVYASRSGLFSRVFAIEAMSVNYELLVANVMLNECSHNTTCFNKALGSEEAKKSFQFNPLNPGGSHQGNVGTPGEEVLLDVVKTSDFMQRLLEKGSEPEVLAFWIDVEGMEQEVVRELREVGDEAETYYCVEYNRDDYSDGEGFSLRSFIESREEIYLLVPGGMTRIPDLSQVRNGQDVVFSAKPGSDWD